MVKGLNKFKEHFKGYENGYILIGGAACDVQLQDDGQQFRATKDLDIILVVEAIDDAFVKHFWDFISAGEYAMGEVNDKKCFYRFHKPAVDGYPFMLELFSRKPDMLDGPANFHITDIDAGEEASSLSAILMDDDYYDFVIGHSENIDGVQVADQAALICLKIKAYLNNRERKEQGQEVQKNDINKHRSDVVRFVARLDPAMTVELADAIKNDIREFIEILSHDQDDVANVMKSLKLGDLSPNDVYEQLIKTFKLATVGEGESTLEST